MIFQYLFDKNIKIKGKKFDATNLPKILNKNEKPNKILKNINKEIQIDFTNIIQTLSENLKILN